MSLEKGTRQRKATPNAMMARSNRSRSSTKWDKKVSDPCSFSLTRVLSLAMLCGPCTRTRNQDGLDGAEAKLDAGPVGVEKPNSSCGDGASSAVVRPCSPVAAFASDWTGCASY